MINIQEKIFAELTLGTSAEFEVLIDNDLVAKFADLSGDVNPLHMDSAYASTTPVGDRVAHGMIGAAFFSRLIGMYLPGKYALFLEQSLKFKRPIYLDTTVVVRGVVSKRVEALNVVELHMIIENSRTHEILTEGYGLVKVLR